MVHFPSFLLHFVHVYVSDNHHSPKSAESETLSSISDPREEEIYTLHVHERVECGVKSVQHDVGRRQKDLADDVERQRLMESYEEITGGKDV